MADFFSLLFFIYKDCRRGANGILNAYLQWVRYDGIGRSRDIARQLLPERKRTDKILKREHFPFNLCILNCVCGNGVGIHCSGSIKNVLGREVETCVP